MAYENFKETIKVIASDYGRKVREVQQDNRLSDIGKGTEIEKLRSDSLKALEKLYANFQQARDKKDATSSKLKKDKIDPIAAMREILRQDTVKDVNLSSYSTVSGPVVSDNARTMLLLQALDAINQNIQNTFHVQALSRRSPEWIRSEVVKASESRDISRLELLRQASEWIDDGAESQRLSAIIEPVLERVRIENLTPQEREVMAELEAIDKEAALVEYTFQNFRERGEYRNAQTQEPENETVLRPVNPNPRLGVSSTADKFVRYKNAFGEPVES